MTLPPTSIGALAGAVLLLGATPASAACALDTIFLPVTISQGLPMVPVKIEDQAAQFVVSSGDRYNEIDARFADQHHLERVPAPQQDTGLRGSMRGGGMGPLQPSVVTVTVQGLGGSTVAPVVVAKAFEFADAHFGAMPMIALDGIGDVADGVMGQEILRRMDDDYDLADAVMQLVKATGCEEANLTYWTKGAYSVVALEPMTQKSPHDVLMVTVDGAPMRAVLDSGVETSFVTVQAAARIGMKTGAAGVTPAPALKVGGRARIKAWKASFASLQIGDEAFRDAALMIADARLPDADMVLGMDFFLSHHIYVANSQGKVYFSPVGAAKFAAGG